MEQTLKDLITLTSFVEDDCKTLRDSAATTQTWADEIIATFYDTLFANKSTAAVFQEGERPHREETFRQWYLEITSGEINPTFWEHQWFVGLIHIKRGVNNEFVIGIMSRVQKLFLDKCMAEMDTLRAEQVFGAFKRVTDIIVGLIVEGYRQQYLSAVERTSGISRALVDRMAKVEAEGMIEEARASLK
ncbi:MAG TPA: protoglobin domain-containing protein [Chloroflexia bacterium]|nr:protoglobin domain-containing protein [Chloroflexia bacterium]